jgi:hypothetical protein
VVTLVLAVLRLALVIAVEPTMRAFSCATGTGAFTSDRGAAGTNPYIEHHAAVVARYHDGSLRLLSRRYLEIYF